ncbi:MAG: 30S ribosome-binding factor RbfA [Clostridia bacterium]|nr:30S ribosome-binding factor RbfA [Clostridia bacterium]
MKGLRGERLSSQFREEIYGVISTDLRNKYPAMSAIISIINADVAPDLKSCKVFVSIYDPNEQKKRDTFKILVENAGYIRHELSKVLRIRTVPELRFVMDESMEYGDKIDKLLKGIEDGNGGAND